MYDSKNNYNYKDVFGEINKINEIKIEQDIDEKIKYIISKNPNPTKEQIKRAKEICKDQKIFTSFLNGLTLYNQTTQEIKNKIIKNDDIEACIHKNVKIKLASIKDIMDKLKIKDLKDINIKDNYKNLIESTKEYYYKLDNIFRLQQKGNKKIDLYKLLLKMLKNVIPSYVESIKFKKNKKQIRCQSINNKLFEDLKLFEKVKQNEYNENVFKKSK
jgi:hypothetical protein